jgi:hypothetical protein
VSTQATHKETLRARTHDGVREGVVQAATDGPQQQRRHEAEVEACEQRESLRQVWRSVLCFEVSEYGRAHAPTQAASTTYESQKVAVKKPESL